ncbi:MAG TPA: FAD-binding protein [Rhizomicrobium sp.]|jgi:glycolate oxidase FAD binding subunit
MTDIAATTEAQVVDAVNGARDWKSPLNIVGNRTKRAFGCVTGSWGTVLDVSRLNGIVDYKPEELILTARPGTPVAEIVAVLAEKHQRLGFDPPDWGPLFDATANTGTIGGAISCDLNGPARVRYGAVRDHLLGFHGVNGFGEAFKAGSKVVKNVTGFDLPKLVCGGFGTLCAMTEVTLRVFPKPEFAATFVCHVPSPAAGLSVLRRVWSSPLEATGLAYLPAAAARVGLDGDVALIRLEGAAAPLEEKRVALEHLLDGHDLAEQAGGDTIFARLGSGAPFVGNALDVWRVAIPPSHADALVKALAPTLWYADWAGGMVWIGMEESGAHIHDLAVQHGGHATLVRASEATRARVSPFPPLSPERLALTRAVKAAFDPLGLFNPGRMVEGL